MGNFIVQEVFTAGITLPDGTVQSLNADSAVTAVFAESRDVALAGDDKYSWIDAIVPKIKNRVGATSLQLVIKGRDRIEEDLETLATLDLADSDLPEFFSVRSYVYYRFRIQASVIPKRWNLFGVQIWGEPDGDYL